MRPVPRSRHLIALAIFAIVAIACGYMAYTDDRLCDSQVHLATAAFRHHHHDALAGDLIYSRTRMWQVHPPMMIAIMETILVPTNYRDLALPFRVLAGLLTLIYLCGMYALLRRQCRSWSVSVFVAVLSSAIINVPGKSFWGIGSLASITPEGICLAIVPVIVLAFIRYADQWQVLLVFIATGLLGNLHLPTAVNLTLVLLIVYLVRQHFTLSRWPIALGCAICSTVALAPYAWYYLSLSGSVADSPMDFGLGGAIAVVEANLPELSQGVGQLLKSTLNWFLVVSVPAIISAIVLSRVERFRVRDLDIWIPFASAALLVAAGFYSAQYFAEAMWKLPLIPVDFPRAAGLMMLPFYALLAQAITNLFRMFRSYRPLVRWGCAAMLAVWMIPSDNVRVGRHAGLDTATMFLDESKKPANVQRHHERDNRYAELSHIAAWAKDNSDPSAVFITDRMEFRMLARRGILIGEGDIEYILRLAPEKLIQWRLGLVRQHLLLHDDNAGAERVMKNMVADLAAEKRFKNVKQWYVILPAAATGKAGKVAPVLSEQWGRYYKLYHLR